MNVETSINIDRMTIGEKLGLMELLWRDLSKEPANIGVPEWHVKNLEEAERAIADGTDEFVDIEAFEAELREQISVRNKR